MKKIKNRPIFMFLSVMFFLTVISKSLYSFFIPNVRIGDIQQGTIKKTIISSSIVQTPRLKSIYSDVSGKILAQNLRENEKVKKGDILISFDTTEMNDKLKYEQLEYEKLKTEANTNNSYIIFLFDIETQQIEIQKQKEKIKKLEDEKNKLETLFGAGAIAEQDLINKKYEIENEKKELNTLQNKLDKLNAELEKLKTENLNTKKLNSIQLAQKALEIKALNDTIKNSSLLISPYNATIIKSYLDGKSILNQSDKLCDIIEDGTSYKAIFSLKKEDIDLLKIGDTVSIKIKSMKNENLEGKITNISNSDERRDITVYFNVSKNVYMQNVEMKYEKESDVYDMLLPNSAIKYDGKNYYINVIDKKENFIGTDYISRRVLIRIIEKNDEVTAISSEVSINEKVVISSDKFIEPGQKLYIKSMER